MSELFKDSDFVEDAPQVYAASEFDDATNDAPKDDLQDIFGAIGGVRGFVGRGALTLGNAFMGLPQRPGTSNALDFAGRNALEIGGGMLGGLNPILSGAGAGAGRLAQSEIRQMAGTVPYRTQSDIVGEAGKTAAINAAGGYLVNKVGGPLAGAAFKRAGQVFGNISEPAMDALATRAPDLYKWMGQGKEVAQDLAMGAKQKIVDYLEEAGKKYEAKVAEAYQKAGGNPINVADAVMDTVGEARKKFGYGVPGRRIKPDEVEVFEWAQNRANELKNATPEEVYYFQRDLQGEIERNVGKPIARALAPIKQKVVALLPEIGEANSIYRGAKELADELGRVSNADDAIGALKRAARVKGDTWKAIEALKAESPEFAKAINDATDAALGTEFTPLMAPLARTGLTGSLLTNAAVIGSGTPLAPAALGLGAVIAPFHSPRLIGLAGMAAHKIGEAAESQLGKPIAEGIKRTVVPATVAWKTTAP